MLFKPTITRDEINELDLQKYEGTVTLVDKEEELYKAFRIINAHDCVGFDTETKPVFVSGRYNHVSLIQIAIPGNVYLIRANLLGLSEQVCGFFENEGIKKIGVALTDDIKDLRKLREFNPQGFLELSDLVNVIGIESNGLRKLTATILGFRISKNAQVSNWEATVLTEKQIRYAATDAWVCLVMYQKLSGLGVV